MTLAITRRALWVGAAAAMPVLVTGKAFAADDSAAQTELKTLEANSGGRLGVVALDTASGATLARRPDERFPLLSTFKVLAAALVLSRVDKQQERLDRRVTYTESDLVPYSPCTKAHLAAGMTMAEICEAAITLSDNTAGNLMLNSFGGPEGLTRYLRSIGDSTSRLDRRETELNEAKPGDPRDTTTPAAMAQTLRKLLLDDVLSAASRQQLIDWMTSNKTGNARLRAGLPAGWRVGDKTGTSDNNAANDVAIVWPPQWPPLIIASYLAETATSGDVRNATHAGVGRVAAAWRPA